MSSDRIKAGLAAFVGSMLHRIDYFALYPAKVVAQNADGTLELQPDDTRLPSQSKVPIRLGIPDAAVKVSAGARVLMGFAGGRPEEPIATIWESGTVTELRLNGQAIKLNGGGVPVATEGSGTLGHTHTITGTAGPYPITATMTVETDSIAPGQGSPTVEVP